MSDHEVDARTVLSHRRLLGARIYVQAHVRLAAAALIAGGAFFARDVLGIENLDVRALAWLALAVATYDLAAYAMTRHLRSASASADAWRRLCLTMDVLIALDFLVLTVGIWLVGGARSPFLAFYLLHVILSSLLLARREAVGVGVFAYGCIAAFVVGEWQGLLHPRLPGGAVAGLAPLDGRFALTILAVYAVLIGVIVFLLVTLVARLRAAEHRLRAANIELEGTASLRRDFLHLALHKFQAPVGAVTTHLRSMTAGIGGTLSEKHQALVARSLRRLDEINHFLKDFRMLATLEAASFDSRAREVDVGAVLAEVCGVYRDQASAREHAVVVDVDPELPMVRTVPELLREAVANYLSNAIKYTPDGGHIVLRARTRTPNVVIEVEDNGVGITTSDQTKLFQEFVRLDHAGTAVAEASGTGLGLSIVRRIIARLGGTTSVRSELGAGSTFEIVLPTARPGRKIDTVTERSGRPPRNSGAAEIE